MSNTTFFIEIGSSDLRTFFILALVGELISVLALVSAQEYYACCQNVGDLSMHAHIAPLH